MCFGSLQVEMEAPLTSPPLGARGLRAGAVRCGGLQRAHGRVLRGRAVPLHRGPHRDELRGDGGAEGGGCRDDEDVQAPKKDLYGSCKFIPY